MMRVTIELHDGGSERPAAGTASFDDGPIAPFDGWLDLLRLVENALDDHRRQAAGGEDKT